MTASSPDRKATGPSERPGIPASRNADRTLATDGGKTGHDDADGVGTRDGPADAEYAYGGLFGAFPYAYRKSDSRLFRIYVVGGGLLALAVALLFALALIVLVSNTASGTGGTFTFSRAFLLVLLLLVVAPLLAPVLSVARRHRRGGSTDAYDRALASGGYLYVLGLYVGLVINMPPEQRPDTTGVLGPVLDLLFSLPRVAGAIPPLLAAALIVALHRRYGD